MTDQKIDLSGSKLLIEGEKKVQEEWIKRIGDRRESLKGDQSDRQMVGRKRYDFFVGDQASYTTVVGKVAKEKKGHANAVYNYAGKTVVKIGYGLANNPPKITIPARTMPEDFIEAERTRSQSVEDFSEEVFRRNRFWKGGYRRACFNQVAMADAFVKVYPVNKGTAENPEWDVKIISQEKMGNILVGWRGDNPMEFDFVIAEEKRTVQSIFDEFGVKVPLELHEVKQDTEKQSSSHQSNGQWGVSGSAQRVSLPSGKTNEPSVTLVEYDDENVYALMIGKQLIQLAFKDDKSFPKMKFWVHVPNIPQPGSPWSISDIDFLIDPQVEFNEASNDERDYIRVGAQQRYVAYNMDEFDPESLKASSGGVIFVNSPDGTAKFDPLQTNVNTFPVDSYLNRARDVIYDMGVPKVTYGASGADSGRSKAIDYQSMVDLLIFKRDSWELALDQVMEKIQILGDFYFKYDFFKDPAIEKFVIRHAEFDWADILPVTQGDKVVNVLNKVTMGLPFEYAFKELGYRDVDAILDAMRREAKDEDLMMFRSKMYQLAGGIVEAQKRAQEQMQGMEETPGTGAGSPPAGGEMVAPGFGGPGAPAVNQPGPVLSQTQNQGRESSLPMAQRGGTTSFTSPRGFIERTRQNLQAAGR